MMIRILMIAGLMSLVVLQSCTTATAEKGKKEELNKFIVTNPVTMDTSFTKEYVAQIRSVRNIEIHAQEKGFLQNIYVDEGQFVKSGQLLFKIMPNLYDAELQKAEAEVKAAEIELQNATALADKNVISKNEQALAQAKLEKAKAERTMAKVHLSFTEIRAPFDGYIDRLPKKIGSLIEEGELLTSLSDNSKMFVYFNVSEPEYLEYKTNVKGHGNNEVRLLLANNQLLKYKGKVEVIESEFDSETGNIAFRAIFPNADNLLRNGETGKILMTVPVKNALIIPQKATYEIQNKKYVFVVGDDNLVKSREINITGEVPDLYVVKSGLTQNEKILLEGVQKVKDDDKINFEYQNPEEVLSHLKTKAE
jgi:membrane fusion protein (multidrug efflux system)